MSKAPTMSTSTTTNASQQAQQPYLNYGYGQAQSLYNNNPQSYYPNQTLAQNPFQQQGYENIYNAGQVMQNNYLPLAQDAYSAIPGYANMLGQYSQQAGQTAQGQGPGMEQLAAAASGQYLNSNPYLDSAIQAAQDPLTRNYQTSIAPTMDAALSQGGRYGSGAQAGLYDTSQQNLAKSLGDVSTNMSNLNYGRERGLQDAAAQQYTGLSNQALNQAMSGAQQAGSLNSMMLNLFPQLMGAQATGAQAQLQAGQGMAGLSQQQIQDEMARYYGQQQAPWKGLEQYMGLIGQPAGAGPSGTQQTPYYSNPIAGVGSLLSGIGGLTSSGGKFGSGGKLGR